MITQTITYIGYIKENNLTKYAQSYCKCYQISTTCAQYIQKCRVPFHPWRLR